MISIYNYETDQTIQVNSLEELIEFLNFTDDVYSFEINKPSVTSNEEK